MEVKTKLNRINVGGRVIVFTLMLLMASASLIGISFLVMVEYKTISNAFLMNIVAYLWLGLMVVVILLSISGIAYFSTKEKTISPKRVNAKKAPKWATKFFDNKVYLPDGSVIEIPKENWE